jgi:multiple sugar transport system substrate-binding protein
MQRRTRWLASGALAVVTAVALTACGSGFSSGGSTTSATGLTSSADPITVMIGSSGPAETKAVTAAVAAWSKSSGTKATVIPANNLEQQMAQGFASGKPADVFYLGTGDLAGYASAGDLLAYGDDLPNKSDFYPSLVSNFTYDNKFYCAPKDFSTLQLIVNDADWSAAGLTSADYPKTWDQLDAVAKKLSTDGRTGLVVSGQYERLGAFMVQNGGNLTNPANTKVTANSAQNVEALTFAKKMLNDGGMKLAADVGASWGGQAFGTNQAAMTIEGNWITGSMSSDYPGIKYSVIPLPSGSAGKGTLQFTNCWGIAAKSPNQKAALSLVEQLTTTKDQLGFAKAYGVMPSLKSAAPEWRTLFPQYTAFLDASSYAEGVPTLKGSAQVVTNLDSQLGTLKTSDPKTILDQTQNQLEALLK